MTTKQHDTTFESLMKTRNVADYAEFIRYAKSHKKVWFATAGEIVKWYRENYRDAQVEEWPNFHHAGRRGKISDLAKL